MAGVGPLKKLSTFFLTNPASFCLFSFFTQCKDNYSTNLTINDKIIDSVFGTRSQDRNMEGAQSTNCATTDAYFSVIFQLYQ